MRHIVAIIAVLFAILAISPAVFATTYNPDNELENWCFIDGSTGWETDGPVVFNQEGYLKWGRPHVAYDPWPTPPGPTGTIRQIVDDTKSPYWNWDLHSKVETLDFDLQTSGTGYVMVGFDLWNTTGSTKPGGVADHEWIDPTHYTFTGDWTHITITHQWYDSQPRWIGLKFAFYGCGGSGNEASVDDVVLVGRCVPEPSSIIGLSGSMLGLMGFALRRRR
jgi:hypothetical protein